MILELLLFLLGGIVVLVYYAEFGRGNGNFTVGIIAGLALMVVSLWVLSGGVQMYEGQDVSRSSFTNATVSNASNTVTIEHVNETTTSRYLNVTVTNIGGIEIPDQGFAYSFGLLLLGVSIFLVMRYVMEL